MCSLWKCILRRVFVLRRHDACVSYPCKPGAFVLRLHNACLALHACQGSCTVAVPSPAGGHILSILYWSRYPAAPTLCHLPPKIIPGEVGAAGGGALVVQHKPCTWPPPPNRAQQGAPHAPPEDGRGNGAHVPKLRDDGDLGNVADRGSGMIKRSWAAFTTTFRNDGRCACSGTDSEWGWAHTLPAPNEAHTQCPPGIRKSPSTVPQPVQVPLRLSGRSAPVLR